MIVQSKFLKTLVGIKIFIALAAILILTHRLTIGEQPSRAQDDAKEEKDADVAADKTPKRRSFLDNLLNLPKLNTETAKKEEIGRYLTLAERKKAQIDERLVILEKKEQQLQNLEKSIDGKLVKMDEERKFLGQTIQQEKDLKGERLTRLIELYDKMEPKKAAPMFEKIDKDLAVALMKSLKQKQVTTILEFMSPDKSVQLSEYFGRVKSMREYDLLKELNQSMRQEFQDCRGMPKTTALEDKEEIKPKLAMATPAKAEAAPAAVPATAPVEKPAPVAETKPDEPKTEAPAETKAK